MADHVEIMRKFYQKIEEGDIDYVLSVLHPELLFHVPESLLYGGVHRGIQGFQEVVQTANQTWQDLQVEPKRFLDAGEYVIVILRLTWTNQKTGKHAETDLAEFFKFDGNKIIEILPFYWDTAAMLKTLT